MKERPHMRLRTGPLKKDFLSLSFGVIFFICVGMTLSFFYKFSAFLPFLTVFFLFFSNRHPETFSFALIKTPLPLMFYVACWGVGFFLLYAFILSFFSLHPHKSFVVWAKTATVYGAILTAHYLILKERSRDFFLQILFFGIFVGSLGLIYEVYHGGEIALAVLNFLKTLWPQLSWEMRICHKPAAAAMALAIFPVGAGLWKRGYRVAPFLFSLSAITIGLQAHAQSAVFAIFLGFLAFLFFFFFPVVSSWMAGLISFFLLVGKPFLKLYLLKTEFFKPYLENDAPTLYQRFVIWDVTVEKIFEKFMWGWGIKTTPEIPGLNQELLPGLIPLHPHSYGLEIWLELGVVGIFFLALAVSWLFFCLRIHPLNRFYTATCGATLTTGFVICGTSYSFWHMWWVGWMGLMSLVIHIIFQEKKSENFSYPWH